jgi:hypothetical protein
VVQPRGRRGAGGRDAPFDWEALAAAPADLALPGDDFQDRRWSAITACRSACASTSWATIAPDHGETVGHSRMRSSRSSLSLGTMSERDPETPRPRRRHARSSPGATAAACWQPAGANNGGRWSAIAHAGEREPDDGAGADERVSPGATEAAHWQPAGANNGGRWSAIAHSAARSSEEKRPSGLWRIDVTPHRSGSSELGLGGNVRALTLGMSRCRRATRVGARADNRGGRPQQSDQGSVRPSRIPSAPCL